MRVLRPNLNMSPTLHRTQAVLSAPSVCSSFVCLETEMLHEKGTGHLAGMPEYHIITHAWNMSARRWGGQEGVVSQGCT